LDAPILSFPHRGKDILCQLAAPILSFPHGGKEYSLPTGCPHPTLPPQGEGIFFANWMPPSYPSPTGGRNILCHSQPSPTERTEPQSRVNPFPLWGKVRMGAAKLATNNT
tara:strand:- start:291 stop:620 length:330 start_codon:yes stop_codon:yes gene_type:complete